MEFDSALNEILPSSVVAKIASVWIDTEDADDDSWFWRIEGDGRFSYKSAYLAQMQADAPSTLPWHKVWSLPFPNKILIFLCRILNGSLPTPQYLHYRHILSYSTSFICSSGGESLLHALRDCCKARTLWLTLNPGLSQ